MSLDGRDTALTMPPDTCVGAVVVDSGTAGLESYCAAGGAVEAVPAAPLGQTADCDTEAWHTLETAEWERRYPGLEIAAAPACVAVASPPPADRVRAGG